MITISTSSFFTSLPPEIARISIARYSPTADRALPPARELAPGSWWHRSVSDAEFIALYWRQLLRLDPRAVVRRIEDIAAGRPAALLCWERPRDGRWCHRALVAMWLHEELALDVREHGLEADGCGASHPKLPAEIRGQSEPLLF